MRHLVRHLVRRVVTRLCVAFSMALALWAGCADPQPQSHQAGHDDARTTSVTNRVAVPKRVRDSLGITFAKAEERAIAQTVRLACHIDTAPEGLAPFHVNLPGTIEVHARLYESVKAGALVVSVVSPQLLEYRHELHTAADAVGAATDVLNVARAALSRHQARAKQTRERLRRIRAAGAAKASLEGTLTELDGDIRVLRAQRKAAQRALVRAEHRFEAELASFAARVGLSVKALEAGDPASADHGATPPRWETIARLEFHAPRAGVVTQLPAPTGAWVGQGDLVAEVRDPSSLRVACRALLSDMARLSSGQSVRVVSPGRPDASIHPVQGTLRVGLGGHGERRTVPAIVNIAQPASWMKPGANVFAEVTVGGTNAKETAVPNASLVRDGLDTILFRRDPDDPDKVIRTVPDLGPTDGRWTAVFSGVGPGDEVVVDGVYELKLESTQRPSATGHFHADGTWHEGEH